MLYSRDSWIGRVDSYSAAHLGAACGFVAICSNFQNPGRSWWILFATDLEFDPVFLDHGVEVGAGQAG
jgi:hypothetical protein